MSSKPRAKRLHVVAKAPPANSLPPTDGQDIPMVCEHCGRIFDGGVTVHQGARVEFGPDMAINCPACDGRLSFVPGSYEIIDGALSVIKSDFDSPADLENLARLLRKSLVRLRAHEDPSKVADELAAVTPALSKLMPQNRVEIQWYLTILLTLVLFAIQQMTQPSPISPRDLDRSLDRAVEQLAEKMQQSPTGFAPQVTKAPPPPP